MRKNLLILAAVLAVSYSCSNDEIVEVNQGNAISFRPLVNNVTRVSSVAEITTDNLASFTVNAMQAGLTTAYFSDVVFTKQLDGSFTSSTKYYWPGTESLDFYAYSPAGNSQVTYTDYKTFDVQPTSGDNPANQVDLVYAATKNRDKEHDAAGVTLNFRHTGAKIVCKVKNSSSALKFGVEGWKVGYLSPKGTFTFSDANTDGNSTGGTGTTLSFEQWGSWTAASVATKYASTFIMKNIAASASETDLDGAMILVPQTLTAATGYATSAVGADLNGTFIAVKLYILNAANDFLIAGGGNTASPTTIWAIWPTGGYNWEPGKKYTYTIDLAGGGYYEQNVKGDDTELDPLLEGAEIKFVTVTVDDWVDTGITNVPVTASYSVPSGTTPTTNYDVANGATGTYTFEITSLTDGHAYTIGVDNNLVLLSSASGTVSGTTQTFTVNLKANSSSAVTNTITFTDTDAEPDVETTITITQAAP